MHESGIPSALKAAAAEASALGLTVDDAVVVHASNRIAVRLRPCDVLARVGLPAHRTGMAFEVELARRLAGIGAPVAALDPAMEARVYERDGFVLTFWTYYETEPREITPAEYALALGRLHESMREIDIDAPRFTDRVASARAALDDRALTPELGDAERALLSSTLERMTASIAARGGEEQLLHGEPHPGNLLNTKFGPLFIDLETCCRGPVEFDLAHAPAEVAEHYPSLDRQLLRECRILMLAMIITWRWEKDDRLPNRWELAAEWTAQLRAELADYAAGRR